MENKTESKRRDKKWELAHYLIEAKKNVDSMIFISENAQAVSNAEITDRVADVRDKFYISCVVLLDKMVEAENIKKWELRKEHPIIKDVYNERNKNSAHKDDDYIEKEYEFLSDIAKEMKEQLEYIREVCAPVLPSVISLNYVPHDRVLFRLANGITPKKEEEINMKKYPGWKKNQKRTEPDKNGETKKIVNRFKDIKKIPYDKTSDYVVIVENGLTTEEGVQNRQDSFIMVNYLFGSDSWPFLSTDKYKLLKDMRQSGIIDKFDTPHSANDVYDDPILYNRFMNFARKYPLE